MWIPIEHNEYAQIFSDNVNNIVVMKQTEELGPPAADGICDYVYYNIAWGKKAPKELLIMAQLINGKWYKYKWVKE